MIEDNKEKTIIKLQSDMLSYLKECRQLVCNMLEDGKFPQNDPNSKSTNGAYGDVSGRSLLRELDDLISRAEEHAG